jgi:hypothetical protein
MPTKNSRSLEQPGLIIETLEYNENYEGQLPTYDAYFLVFDTIAVIKLPLAKW